MLRKTDLAIKNEIPKALSAYSATVEGNSNVVNNQLKRFKHGETSDTFLAMFDNGNMCVLKVCPISEVIINKNIPAQHRNCDLIFHGEKPFGRFICITHVWFDGKLHALDDVDWSKVEKNKKVITFQPYFDGASNFFRDATPEQYPDWANCMAQLVCFAKLHDVKLNDFSGGNYRYDPVRKLVGIFDWPAPDDGFESIDEFVYGGLKTVFESRKPLDASALKQVDVSVSLEFLQKLIEYSGHNAKTRELKEKAERYVLEGSMGGEQIDQFFRWLGNLRIKVEIIKQLFEDIESKFNASFFVQHHNDKRADILPYTDDAKKLSSCLRAIVKESVSGRSGTVLQPDVIERHLSDLGGAAFGKFMAHEIDPLYLILWFALKIGSSHLALLSLLTTHVFRDKLSMAVLHEPIGTRSKEWEEILAEVQDPAA
jgi:hypothetical protein